MKELKGLFGFLLSVFSFSFSFSFLFLFISVNSPVAVFSATDPTAHPGISTYYWQTIGAGWSGTGSSSSFIDSIGAIPDTVICIVSNICGSAPADTFVVTPALTPASSFSIENHVTEIITNDVITFSGTAPSGSIYTWGFGAGYISASPGTGAGPQTVMYGTPGLVTVSLSVDNAGCISNVYTDTILVIDTALTAMKAVTHSSVGMHIVPNPSDGIFDIVFDNPINNSFMVKLVDMQGRLVYSNQFSRMTGNKISVDAGDLPTGTYTVSVFINDVPNTEKITITK